MKRKWLVLWLLLGLASPCHAGALQDNLKKLKAEANRWMNDIEAWIKRPPKGGKTEIEDDLKDAGHSLEKAADRAAKKIKSATK